MVKTETVLTNAGKMGSASFGPRSVEGGQATMQGAQLGTKIRIGNMEFVRRERSISCDGMQIQVVFGTSKPITHFLPVVSLYE